MPDAANNRPQGDSRRIVARPALDEHGRMVLTGADRDAFLSAVLKPPALTAKLITALLRHRDVVD